MACGGDPRLVPLVLADPLPCSSVTSPSTPLPPFISRELLRLLSPRVLVFNVQASSFKSHTTPPLKSFPGVTLSTKLATLTPGLDGSLCQFSLLQFVHSSSCNNFEPLTPIDVLVIKGIHGQAQVRGRVPVYHTAKENCGVFRGALPSIGEWGQACPDICSPEYSPGI